MKGKISDDLVLKAALGEAVYAKVKKHIAAWRAEYVSDKPRMGWIDYLQMKVAEHQGMATWNIYRGQERVGTIKALTADDAIKQISTVVHGTLTARKVMTSIMST